jgi:hypothetical protein
MSARHPIRLLFVRICSAQVFALALSMPAMGQDTSGPSVTLAVSPQQVTQNAPVTISGLGYAQSGTAVIVTVAPPGGAKVTLNATPNPAGHYSLQFTQTTFPGSYAVSAQLGTSGAPAQAKFEVRKFVQSIGQITADHKKLATDIVTLTDDIKQAVDALPDSPAKTQTSGKLDALDARMQQLPQQSEYLGKALALFSNLQAQHPETAQILQPLYDKLDAWDEQARQHQQALDQEIADSRKNLGHCDLIDQAIERLNAVSGALNLAALPGQIIKNFLNDATAPIIASKIPGMGNAGPNAQFAANEVVKLAPAVTSVIEGPFGLITTLAGMVVDVAAQAAQNVFSQYCQKFDGPFSATMVAHFYTKDGQEWWNYSIAIAGTLTLRYPKDTSGHAVALSGQFLGRATGFTYNEYFWTTSGAGLARGGAVKTIDVTPVAPPNVDWEGRGWSNLTSPTSFDIPVNGQFADGRISFKLGDARADFNADYTQAHTVYMLMTPLTLGLPVWGHFTLPYKDAHFVLQHYVFDYPVTQTGKSMQIEQDVQERDGPGNKARYTITLKACNPGCG